MKRTFRLSESRPDPRRDVSDEIRFHLEMRARELIEQGVPTEDAWREARRHFGDVAAIEAECREVRIARTEERRRRDWMRGWAMDLRYAARSLWMNAGFTAAAIATLGLGIGAAAAVFTVVDGVLLRPLPYAEPSRLVMMWMTNPSIGGAAGDLPLSSGLYVDARDAVKGLAPMAAFRAWPFVVSGTDDGAEPEQVPGARVEPELFTTLGVRPMLGRAFTRDEAGGSGTRVAVISHALWQRRFGGASDVIGRSVTLSGERFAVVGVMPPGFAFPRGAELPPGLQFGTRTDVWVPLAFSEEDRGTYWTLNLSAVARVAPGVALQAARSELVRFGERRLRELGAPPGRLAYTLVGMADQAASKVRSGLLVLMGAVAFVLLIACTNVANLLVARTGTRDREFAVRAALGAGRSRIVRQLVTENLVLAIGGAVVGLGVAALGARVMLALVPGSLPRADDVSVDLRVILFAWIVAILAGSAFGTAAAVHVTRRGVAETLQSGGARLTGGVRRRIGRRLLVATEVALSLVLLVGAGLLAGSFARLQRVTPGFNPTGTMTADLLLPVGDRFDPAQDGAGWARFFDELTARVNRLPGVAAAGAVSTLPLSGAVESGGYTVEGEPPPPRDQRPSAEYSVVSGNYFAAMGIRLLAGRSFDTRDRQDSPGVVIVNREFARRHFRNTSPLGRRIAAGFDFSGGAPREIVGVVENVKQTALDVDAMPAVYVPESQMTYPFLSIVVRASCGERSASCDPAAVMPAVRRELAGMRSSLALSNVRPMSDVLADSIARQRFSMTVLALFAALALALALVGLYGVIALSVGQRRREIGVRVALGARPRDVLGLILGEGMRVTLLGVVIGVAGAAALTRVLRGMVFDVSTTDPRFYGAAALLVGAVSLLATYVPARRALRVDAMQALRTD